MQKTIDITLAGTRFTLEERAYERLVAYTTSLETHFTANAEKQRSSAISRPALLNSSSPTAKAETTW